MKTIITVVALAITIISCTQKNKQEGTSKTESATKVAAQSAFSIDIIVKNYLAIKNSLANDDSDAAADAGKALSETMAKTDMKKVSADQMEAYMSITDDAKEHADHIGSNGGKIEHQREHFITLSKDMNDLIQLFGTNQKLYLDFCPMADDNKGAVWISETKEITNPYFGKDMATCGSIKKEF
ncbi:hypothetical protein GCM10008015_12000 [Flavobacterium palustre]|uniref:DUF3347 domain-containing protein n=1 Tax=Flavobacterium palustre TaxID=1476463 RepID=A0ABQ1HDX2_9FLAO|nr:DUF3347 domain-containing protein [Flavobacterium palustre]GGA72909.1 hypothetical protein GCM10008015_12000 [Flavobacterium palustre]HTG65837.1 DUF3347 domain-containing protein [Flavobacterium sp.]